MASRRSTISTPYRPDHRRQAAACGARDADHHAGRRRRPDHGFRAALSGDILPLVAPAYQDFFGPEVSLAVAGRRAGDGTLELSELALGARGMTLTGSAALAADGLPQRFDLTAERGARGSDRACRADRGRGTVVRAGTVRLGYDAARSELDAGRAAVRGAARGDGGAGPAPDRHGPHRAGGRRAGHGAAASVRDRHRPGARRSGRGDRSPLSPGNSPSTGKGAPLRLTDLALIGRDQALSGTAEVSAVAGDLRLSGAIRRSCGICRACRGWPGARWAAPAPARGFGLG